MIEKFYKPVSTTDRAAMIRFLSEHFRYNTMNSWNRSTSYANNMKVYNLGLTPEQEKNLLQLMDIDDPMIYSGVNMLLREFSQKYNHKWQAKFNRGGSYLVLYQGEKENDKIVSYPGRSTDMNEDFTSWDNDALKDRVLLVQDFDKLCDDIANEAAYVTENYEIKEVSFVTTKKVILPKE